MNIDKKLVAILVVIIISALFFYKEDLSKMSSEKDTSQDPVFCTMDAKICPDGSYVGRVGPSCEFSECPAVKSSVSKPAPVSTQTPKPVNNDFEVVSLKQGQTGKALNTTLRILEILEDSRCPSDVTCIQAGTVKLRVTVTNSDGTTEHILVLNNGVLVGKEKITLTTVIPENISTTKISNNGYQFLIKVEKNR